MQAVTRKMADLKDEILSKIDQKFSELKLEFLSELKDQFKREVSEAIKTEINQNGKNSNEQYPCCRSM